MPCVLSALHWRPANQIASISGNLFNFLKGLPWLQYTNRDACGFVPLNTCVYVCSLAFAGNVVQNNRICLALQQNQGETEAARFCWNRPATIGWPVGRQVSFRNMRGWDLLQLLSISWGFEESWMITAMSSNSFRAEHAQCTHSPPRLKQMPHRQQWPATIPPRQYYSNIMQWPTTPLLTCRIAGICRRYNHYNAICIHTLQNTKGEPITIETIQTAPAAHTRCLSSPAAATLDGKTQGFVPMSPLPLVTTSLWCKVSHHPSCCYVM